MKARLVEDFSKNIRDRLEIQGLYVHYIRELDNGEIEVKLSEDLYPSDIEIEFEENEGGCEFFYRKLEVEDYIEEDIYDALDFEYDVNIDDTHFEEHLSCYGDDVDGYLEVTCEVTLKRAEE